jgi:F1F0 ATPase subunit 2
MSEYFALSSVFLAGAALGTVFFGGLWWTVNRGVTSRHPTVWFLGSLLLRGVVTIGGFAYLAHNDWRRIVACAAGFFVARAIVTVLSRNSPAVAKATCEGGPS